MSSQIEQEQFIEGLREDGILDSLKDQMGRTEAPEEETAVEPEIEEEVPAEEPEVEEAEETPEAEEEVEPEASYEADEEDVEYTLDTEDPLVKAYLDKYDGDLDKAIKAAANYTDVIGRQGDELGDLRRELRELRERMEAPQPQAPQPYRTFLPDPDEAEDEELAAAYSSLAHEALERADAETLQRSVEAWKDLDPFGASVFVGQLQARVYEQRLAEVQTSRGPDELEQGMESLKEKYPDLASRVQEIGEEAERWPTLGYVLHDGTPAERVQALEALYLQVANRQTTETSQQALRKVAVKNSEEARRARQQAQVASSGRGSVAEPEAKPHLIPLGKTGRSVDLNRVDEILKSDRI